jgi:hypothetical protein
MALQAFPACPVDKLPDEILNHIFSLYGGNRAEILPKCIGRPSALYTWPLLFPVCATCRRWYRVVRDHQKNQFRYLSYDSDVSELDEWRELLQGGVGQETEVIAAIRLRETQDRAAVLLITDNLPNNSSSLRSLSLHAEEGAHNQLSILFECLSNLEVNTSSIKELRVSSTLLVYDRADPTHRPLSFPSLISLRLYRSERTFMPFGPILGEAFPSLRLLSLRFVEQFERMNPDLSQLITVLQQCPRLLILEVESNAHSVIDGPAPVTGGVVAPNLVKLEVSGNLGLIKALLSWVKYPALLALHLHGPKRSKLTHFPPVTQPNGACFLQNWLTQADGGLRGSSFPSLVTLMLQDCGPTLPIYLIFYCQMKMLKHMCFMNVERTDGGRIPRYHVDEATWSLMADAGPIDLDNLEKLDFMDFPRETVPTLLSRLSLQRLRFLNILNDPTTDRTAINMPHYYAPVTRRVIGEPAAIKSLAALAKMEIAGNRADAEALLDICPGQLDSLEILGLRVFRGGMFNPFQGEHEPRQKQIKMPKLRFLDLPDYDNISLALLDRLDIEQSVKQIRINLQPKFEIRPTHLDHPEIWVRILDVHRNVFAQVTQLDMVVPKDAFDYTRDRKAGFPLLSGFPNLSVLTLRMRYAKPEYLAFLMEKGRDPRQVKYKPPTGRRLDRLNLHILPMNGWAAGLDRMIKGYASQGIPLPSIWLFYDTSQQPGFSELNREWLDTIPDLKQWDEKLLKTYSTFDASVTNPQNTSTNTPLTFLS